MQQKIASTSFDSMSDVCPLEGHLMHSEIAHYFRDCDREGYDIIKKMADTWPERLGSHFYGRDKKQYDKVQHAIKNTEIVHLPFDIEKQQVIENLSKILRKNNAEITSANVSNVGEYASLLNLGCLPWNKKAPILYSSTVKGAHADSKVEIGGVEKLAFIDDKLSVRRAREIAVQKRKIGDMLRSLDERPPFEMFGFEQTLMLRRAYDDPYGFFHQQGTKHYLAWRKENSDRYHYPRTPSL